MKIETLTPEQIGRFQEFIERWTEIGLSTDPADRPRAEAAVRKMYEIAGLAPPRVVWCGSPAGMAITRAVLLKMPDSVGASVGASVWASVGDSVWASVRASVGASVWDSVGDSVWASVRDSVRDSVYGQHDACWLAFYRYFHDVLGLREQTQHLDGLWEFSQAAGWAAPCRNICFVADRHNVLKRDERGRLHAEDGPACAYPDDWAIYAWHGTRIPAAWIEDRASLTAKIALTQENIEQRRVACEIVGWAHILKELKGKTIDTDCDPEIGELIEVRLPNAGKERFLRVRCGTGREFAIPVPPTMKTALDANRWTYDIPADLMRLKEYRT